jgi:23S rRNA pseudouridine2605 synthase
MTRNNPRKNRRKSVPAGHPGRGKPKVSDAERRNAHALIAGTDSPEAGVKDSGPGVRLNRWLAERGVDSRRKCDALIQEANIEVNGEIRMDPGYRVQEGDVIKMNGRLIKEVRRLYYLFYKPKGVLCTADKRETRPRVGDLVDHLVPSRVYPVGRLDEDSEGLLLLTNDGDFAHMMMHPSFGVPKTYLTMISQPMTGDDIDALRKGAWVDGQKITPERLKVVSKNRGSTLIEVIIREGRNREVRRLFSRHGFGVKNLKRVRIGTLGVKGVRRGGLRPLTRAERDALVETARGQSGSGPVRKAANPYKTKARSSAQKSR